MVYVPRAFDVTRSLNIVVFIHGWYNCIQNVMRPTDSGNSVCTKGGAARRAYGLINQVEASGKNVLLIVSEPARDTNSGNQGRFGSQNGFRNFLNELLSERLAPMLGGPMNVNQIDRLILFGHSAAYQTTSSIVKFGGVDNILREVHLLDSLYGNEAMYNEWITAHRSHFDNTPSGFKFSNIYFASTLKQSEAQAGRVRSIVPAGSFLYQSNAAVKESAAMFQTAVLFKASSVLSHDGIPAAFVGPILSASPI
jgi:hypothetical protein